MIKLYIHYLSIHIKSIMEYKTSFILTALGQFFVSFNIFISILFMFDRFHTVSGFTFEEVVLCYGIFLLSFTLAECIFRAFDTFPGLISNGEFDRIMLRPQNIVFQVVAAKVDLTRIGRLLQALVMVLYAFYKIDLTFTPLKVLTLLFMLLSGFLVFAGIYILYAGVAFFTLEGLEFLNIFTDGAREHGKYPIGVYGKTLLNICTYAIPFALIQYYPFLYLIGRSDSILYVFLPLAALWFIIPCYIIWRIGLAKYQSTGS